MSRRNKGRKNRRETLLKSLDPSENRGLGFTTHWVKEMVEVFSSRLASGFGIRT